MPKRQTKAVPPRHRTPYEDAELRAILSSPPTWPNVKRFAAQHERTEAAIRLIYDVAATRRSHLNAAMNAKAFWKQVRRVAAELGWITVGKREGFCPACGSRSVLPIVYGYPGEELQEAERRGEVVLGGCCIEDGQPLARCGACGHEWGARAPSRRRTVRKPGRPDSPLRRDHAVS